TKYEYDNYTSDATHEPLVDRLNISGHDSNIGTGYVPRGNLTKVTRYADAQNQTRAVTAHSQFDIAGNPIKSIDAKRNVTTLTSDDTVGPPDAEARTNIAPSPLDVQQTCAYPTSATNPVGYTAYTQVDYFTGGVGDAEEINGNIGT